MYTSVRVKMSNGEIRKAELRSMTTDGYRTARVDLGDVKVRGRVTARHGFTDGRVHNFEVLAEDATKFFGLNTYVKAA